MAKTKLEKLLEENNLLSKSADKFFNQRNELRKQLSATKRELTAVKKKLDKVNTDYLTLELNYDSRKDDKEKTEKRYESMLENAVHDLNKLSKREAEYKLKYERLALVVRTILNREYENDNYCSRAIVEDTTHSVYSTKFYKEMLHNGRTP